MIPAVYLAAITFLPEEFNLRATVGNDFLTLHPFEATMFSAYFLGDKFGLGPIFVGRIGKPLLFEDSLTSSAHHWYIACISVFYMWIFLVFELTSISNVYGLVVSLNTLSNAP